MLLNHALTEMLLAKDYTAQSRQRSDYALEEFIAWAKDNDTTQVEDITSPRRFSALRSAVR